MEVFYDDGVGVRVDGKTVIIHDKTYAISNINSVSIVETPAKSGQGGKVGCAIILALIGLFLVAQLMNIVAAPKTIGGYIPVIVILVAILLFGILTLRGPWPDTPPSWNLVFSMSNGEVQALTGVDEAAINNVREAIERAMRSH